MRKELDFAGKVKYGVYTAFAASAISVGACLGDSGKPTVERGGEVQATPTSTIKIAIPTFEPTPSPTEAEIVFPESANTILKDLGSIETLDAELVEGIREGFGRAWQSADTPSEQFGAYYNSIYISLWEVWNRKRDQKAFDTMLKLELYFERRWPDIAQEYHDRGSFATDNNNP